MSDVLNNDRAFSLFIQDAARDDQNLSLTGVLNTSCVTLQCLGFEVSSLKLSSTSWQVKPCCPLLTDLLPATCAV
jgi:hypothetical protein